MAKHSKDGLIDFMGGVAGKPVVAIGCTAM